MQLGRRLGFLRRWWKRLRPRRRRNDAKHLNEKKDIDRWGAKEPLLRADYVGHRWDVYSRRPRPNPGAQPRDDPTRKNIETSEGRTIEILIHSKYERLIEEDDYYSDSWTEASSRRHSSSKETSPQRTEKHIQSVARIEPDQKTSTSPIHDHGHEHEHGPNCICNTLKDHEVKVYTSYPNNVKTKSPVNTSMIQKGKLSSKKDKRKKSKSKEAKPETSAAKTTPREAPVSSMSSSVTTKSTTKGHFSAKQDGASKPSKQPDANGARSKTKVCATAVTSASNNSNELRAREFANDLKDYNEVNENAINDISYARRLHKKKSKAKKTRRRVDKDWGEYRTLGDPDDEVPDFYLELLLAEDRRKAERKMRSTRRRKKHMKRLRAGARYLLEGFSALNLRSTVPLIYTSPHIYASTSIPTPAAQPYSPHSPAFQFSGCHMQHV